MRSLASLPIPPNDSTMKGTNVTREEEDEDEEEEEDEDEDDDDDDEKE